MAGLLLLKYDFLLQSNTRASRTMSQQCLKPGFFLRLRWNHLKTTPYIVFHSPLCLLQFRICLAPLKTPDYNQRVCIQWHCQRVLSCLDTYRERSLGSI